MNTVSMEDGVNLAVFERGAGQPVLFIHGWMTSSGVWDGVLDLLQGVRAITYDQRGAGASDKPASGYTLEAYINDALTVVKALELETVLIVGHSCGGQIAMGLAAALGKACSGLLLVNPVPPAGMAMPDEAAGLFKTSGGDRDKLGMILNLACVALPAEEHARLVKLAMSVAPVCVAETYMAWTGGGIQYRLGRIKAPTLVIASDDPFLPVALLQETVVDAIAGAKLAFVAGAGHYPCNELPAQTAAVMQRFFEARV